MAVVPRDINLEDSNRYARVCELASGSPTWSRFCAERDSYEIVSHREQTRPKGTNFSNRANCICRPSSCRGGALRVLGNLAPRLNMSAEKPLE